MRLGSGLHAEGVAPHAGHAGSHALEIAPQAERGGLYAQGSVRVRRRSVRMRSRSLPVRSTSISGSLGGGAISRCQGTGFEDQCEYPAGRGSRVHASVPRHKKSVYRGL